MDLRSGECNVVSLHVLCCPVNGSVCFVCCVFVKCLGKQFAICLGVQVILLLNVMELLCVVGGALLDRPCMVFHRMCVLCMWSQCLDAPSICLSVLLYVGSYLLIQEFENWITSVCSSYLVSLCDFAYYVFV